MRSNNTDHPPRRAAALAAVLVCAAAAPRAASGEPAVTRQYIGVAGAHESVEITLRFDQGAVTGLLRQVDGGPEWRLAGQALSDRVELQAFDAAGRPEARLALAPPRDGLLRGLLQGPNQRAPLQVSAEEVANDLPGSQAVNGHYVREGASSGGSLDLLLLDGGRVKVQGHASWAALGGRAAAGEVTGWAVWDGEAVRLPASSTSGCELTMRPVEGGLEVTSAGRCPGDFAGRYARRSSVVPDWETFNWAGP